MSTTLVPPSYYVVKPRGQIPRHYATLAQAAREIARLAPTPTHVRVITGRRIRSLTDSELRELAGHLRTQRLYRARRRQQRQQLRQMTAASAEG